MVCLKKKEFAPNFFKQTSFQKEDKNSFNTVASSQGVSIPFSAHFCVRGWCNSVTFLFFTSDPQDIDMFTGALSERYLPGSYLGPTNACILGNQFRSLKLGDRFFYENPFSTTGFTLGELSYHSCKTVLSVSLSLSLSLSLGIEIALREIRNKYFLFLHLLTL